MARRGPTQLPGFTKHEATTPPENADLIEELSFQHRQIRRLWADLQLAHRRNLEEAHGPEAGYGILGQRELGRRLVRELAEHEALELEELYPVAAEVVGEVWAEHARADHAEVRDLLDEIDGENPQDEAVFDIFTQVLTKILAHLEEEEDIIFPMLRAVLSEEELAAPRSRHPAGAPRAPVIDIAQAERDLVEEASGAGQPGPRSRSRFSDRLRRR